MRFAFIARFAAAIVLATVPAGIVVMAVPADAQSCGSGYYRNSRGNCIPSPRRAQPGQPGGARGLLGSGSSNVPAGASARCRDGTYSFSQSRSGTCSRHGGVASWL